MAAKCPLITACHVEFWLVLLCLTQNTQTFTNKALMLTSLFSSVTQEGWDPLLKQSFAHYLSRSHLRLRERGRTCGERRPPSSSVMLSVLPKCLDRKCSSSMVGWKGSWCRRSWDELDDWGDMKRRQG